MYGSTLQVKALSGIKPADLGLTTDQDLELFLINNLENATEIINEQKGRDYEQDIADGKLNSVPRLAHQVAEHMVCNLITLARARRQSPTVYVNDQIVRLADDKVMTKEVMNEIAMLPGAISGGTGLLFFRVPGAVEYAESLEEEDA